MTNQLRSIPDTEALVGWAGAHSVVVDRPEGKASGRGLGFDGGQLLGLAIGGCFCNDPLYVADEIGIRLVSAAVDVTVTFASSPPIATGAHVQVRVEAPDENTDVGDLIRRAQAMSTVSNSILRGLPVTVAQP